MFYVFFIVSVQYLSKQLTVSTVHSLIQ